MVESGWLRKAGHNRKHDPHLAPKGWIQAKETAERLAAILTRDGMKAPAAVCIISSPFVRCIETASVIAEKLDAPSIKVEPGICEVIHVSPPEYLSAEQLKETFPRIDESYVAQMHPSAAEYGDDICIHRSAKVARTICAQHEQTSPSTPLVFVGHGASCAGIFDGLVGRVSYQGLCTVTHLVRPTPGEKWRVLLEGDAAHLSDKTNLRPY